MKNSYYKLIQAVIACTLLFFTSCQSIKLGTSSLKDSADIILFDGNTLNGWEKTDYAGKGNIFIDKNGSLVLEMGAELSGLHWKGQDLPVENYEIDFKAMRTMGSDFFCGLTFPYKDSHATLILGGWGGSLIGISSLDDFDASENETGDAYIFEDNKWYDIRLRVTDSEITVWIDEKEVIDCEVTGRKVAMRFGEIEMSVPLGITTFATTGKFGKIVLTEIK
ncbi:DUF1080 domain-containing protein [Opitutales bacterium]|nr:DUF1080 domain-containing protein [Opitutales bacterium]